jgi:hypothetical protein
MTPSGYISGQDASKKEILTNIHGIIMDTDKSVVAKVSKMMGKEMIIYKAN